MRQGYMNQFRLEELSSVCSSRPPVMAAFRREYREFETSDETYQVPGTTSSVIVYKGTPLHGDPDDRRFLRVGVLLPDRFMCLDDFHQRLDGALLAHDFDLLKRPSDPFVIWRGDGACLELPRRPFFTEIAVSDSLETWSAKQANYWARVVSSVQKAVAPSSGGNPVLARFLHPRVYAAARIVFSTTESGAFFDRDELENHVNSATEAGHSYTVMTWTEAKADPSLVLLSTSPFGFYHTFIVPADYNSVCTKAKTVPQEREWPGLGEKQVDPVELAKTLKIVGNPSDDARDEKVGATITLSKISGARGMRPSASKQGQVSGTSATVIAEKLWAKKSDSDTRAANDSLKCTAEWLHRVAFCFGGLGDSSRYMSAQQKRNLVFGTYECNSTMIRAENAIGAVMGLLGSKASGTLVTENVLSGTVERRSASGFVETVAIPEWMETRRTEDLWWLCMRLKYEFTVKDDLLNNPLAIQYEFDPFSRYSPFRIEGVLDYALLKTYVTRARRARASLPPPAKIARVGDAEGRDSTKDDAHSTSPVGLSSLESRPTSLGTSTLSSDRTFSSMPSRPDEITAQFPSKRALTRGPQSPHSRSLSVELFRTAYPEPSEPGTPILGTVTGGLVESDGALVHSAYVYRHTARQGQRPSAVTGQGPHDTVHIAHNRLSSSQRADEAPEAMTVRGTISLFGNADLTADLSTWSDSAPSPGSPNPPIQYARAIVTSSFRLSSILPVLRDSLLDSLSFQRRVVFTHQNAPIDSTKAVGWHFDADFYMDEACGAAYSFLRSGLDLTLPPIRLHAGLGMQQSWQEPLRIHSFVMDGSFPGIAVRLCEELTISSVGIEIFGVRYITSVSKLQTGMTFGFGLFGTIDTSPDREAGTGREAGNASEALPTWS